ncbi:hypothetical protein BHF22_03330 [Escherichia coli]|uniref:acyltransferase family protein n=1 Tax=Escherichia coli TaxID=562 RepID=UPI0008543554|nr:acyltransferase [Escherichia coli]OEM24374.1 hypothetical protein BHF22_03330 [Escherichia coli]
MKTVSDVLSRDNNNLDLIRIVAAVMVIYGHSFFLANNHGARELITQFFPFTYSGSIAVKIFFFISGLLVTTSLIRTQSVPKFVISRFFRIYPAYVAVILITSLILGPMLSSLDISTYLKGDSLFRYIYGNLQLNVQHVLPGLFSDNIYKSAVNGSLWTIYYEVCAYVSILALFAVTGLKNKNITTLTCIAVIVLPVFGWNSYVFINSTNKDIFLLPPCFALGVIYAVNKEKISVNLLIPVGFFAFYCIVNNIVIKQIMFYFSLCTLSLYISSLQFILKIKIKNDISYGVYLWGFFVQQCVYKFLPNISLISNQIISIALSMCIAYVSFITIEKPCITLSKRLNNLVLIKKKQ